MSELTSAVDELFPLQAHDRHVRRVLSGQEVPPGLESVMRESPIFYRRVLSREECNADVFVESVVIPLWASFSGIIGVADSWVNGLGEPVRYDEETDRMVRK